jgi:hypothetical protein
MATPLIASDPDKVARLQERDIVFALEPLRWSLGRSEIEQLDPSRYECNGVVCLYTVQACDPLYVVRQDKSSTWVMPLSKKLTDNGLPKMDLAVGFGHWKLLSGGWSSESKKEWTLSRDECLAKIVKPATEAPATKPAESQPPEKPPNP